MKKVLKSTSVALLSATLLATVTPALTNTVSATTNSFESKQPEKSPLITSEWFEEDILSIANYLHKMLIK